MVLEGIDGSGTTTQCTALAERLRARGHRVTTTREPSRGEIGVLTRAQLAADRAPLRPDALALLFAADRLEHLQREIEPALGRGEVVLCDRYLMSSWAYQSLDCPLEWVRSINERALWPDLTLLVAVPAEVGVARVQARQAAHGEPEERFDVPDLQRRLERAYEAFADDASLRDVVRVDGTRSIDEVTQQLLEACDALWASDPPGD